MVSRVEVGCRRQEAAICCDQRVVVVVLVEALPSRVRVEARSTWSRGQRRVEGPATVSYRGDGLCNDGQAAGQEGDNGSIRLDWARGAHRDSMNTLPEGSPVKPRTDGWSSGNRGRGVVRGRASAQRLTEKGQQGQDLKSVDIGAMAKADCASCWRDPGLEFSSPQRLDQPAGQPSQLSWTTPVKVVSRLAWGASTWHWTQLHSYSYHGTTALLPVCGLLGLCPALWWCSARCGCRGRGLALPGVRG